MDLLVAAGDDYAILGRLARHHVYARSLLEHERHATDGCLSVLLDLCLCLGCAVPMAKEEASVPYALLELLIVVALIDVSVAIVEGLLEDVLLNVLKELLHVVGKTFYRACLLLQRVAAHNLDGAFPQGRVLP